MKRTTYRGITFTDEDTLRVMGRFDKELRDSLPARRWKRYAIKHRDQLYPPKTILGLVTGLSKVGGGGYPVNSRFDELGFEIVTIDENEPAVVENQEEEFETEASFSLEYDLENSLVANLEQLEAGMRLYSESGLTGQQLDTKLVGRIDLLTIDAGGNLVVIELKAEEADRQVCGQIQAYMGWVEDHLAGGRKVRGVIVASDFTPRAIYAAKVVPNLSLKKYQVSFRFTDVQPLVVPA